MPVAFVNANSFNGFDLVPFELITPITVSGTDRLLVAAAMYRDDGVPDVTGYYISAASYDGVAMTFSDVVGIGVNTTVEVWHLVAPNVGTFDLRMTIDGLSGIPGADAVMVIGGSSFDGVDQVTPLGPTPSATGSSTTPQVNVTGTSVNNMLMDVLVYGSNSPNPAVTAGQTERWDDSEIDINGIRGASSTYPGLVGVRAMGWTLSASRVWAMMGFEILAAAAPGGSVRDTIRNEADRMVPWRR